MRHLIMLITAALAAAMPAAAQENGPGLPLESPDPQDIPVLSRTAAAAQEACLDRMSGFPQTGPVARYQFFRLVEELALGADAEMRAVLAAYVDGPLDPRRPVADIIEAIANPVLRQAVPSRTVAQMHHLIAFAHQCQPYVDGQINSLEAFDPALASADFNQIVAEDALFLRQILTDALYRLGADRDPAHELAVAAYSASLVRRRDDIEYAAFESEIVELEAIFMGDLDERLALSNAMINDEMNEEATSASVALSNDMTEATKQQHREQLLRTIFTILNGH